MTVPAHCFDGNQKRGAHRRYPQTMAKSDQPGRAKSFPLNHFSDRKLLI
jgi:hypothetical protein